MKKIFYIVISSFIFYMSCTDSILDQESTKVNPESNLLTDSLDINNKQFSKILSAALTDQDVRAFIRSKALTQIDKDYTVIYHLVKNDEVSRNKSFRQLLADYSKLSLSELDKITATDPTLTILVPYVDSLMNVNTWDVKSSDNIDVIFRPYSLNIDVDKLLAYNLKGEEIIVNRFEKPNNQVLVVKSNERLVSSKANNTKNSSNASLSNEDGIFAYFLNDEFNNEDLELRSVRKNDPAQKYDKLIYAHTHGIPFERDYVYYDLKTPTSSGLLDRTYQEYLHSIYFNSKSSYNIVVKSSDITEGALELFLDFIFVKNTGQAFNFRKVLHVPIDEMFRVENGVATSTYKYKCMLPLFCWDLSEFGDTFKISISEYDNGKETTTTHTVTSNYTSNLKTDATVGLDLGIFKFGWGGGVSGTKSETKTTTTQIKLTENTAILGDAFVNFYENSFLNDDVTMGFYKVVFPGRRNRSVTISKNNTNGIDEVNKYISGWISKGIQTGQRVYSTGAVSFEIYPLSLNK